LIGIFFIPALFVAFERLAGRKRERAAAPSGARNAEAPAE
jgi:hypothetical protein